MFAWLRINVLFISPLKSSHRAIMIIRSCSRSYRTTIRPFSVRRVHQGRQLRKYTTSSASASTPASPPSSFSALGSVTSELDKLSPRFEIQPFQIQILKSPTEFYDTLKVRSDIISFTFSPIIVVCSVVFCLSSQK
jgi:hypothetical protein